MASRLFNTTYSSPPNAKSNGSRERLTRLGDRLLQRELITPQQLQQALDVQERTGAFLGQIVVDLGFSSAATVGGILAAEFGVPYVDLLNTRPDLEAVHSIPEETIRQARAIPLRSIGESLEVAMVDPLDWSAIDTIHLATGKRVLPQLTMSWELQRTINDYFDAYTRTSEALKQLENEAQADGKDIRGRAELVVASEAPIVRLVDSLFESALALRASDIHFEPTEKGIRVRYRVDGTLIEQAEIPRNQQAAVVARLKVLCLMDITESRRPQDGRMRYESHSQAFDLRVSSVPAVFGEKLVFRILDKTSVMVPLAKLGFQPEQQGCFERMIRQPHGMIVVVGPTGSGKSTTLYSALNMLNDDQRNIMTLEDPVEYNIAGLNQVQVNPRIGLTFASGLRAFVRQDPDVILVGEIRDRETADMAVQASLTGHLVLTTLHTNSAVGTFPRLTNLGLDPFLIAQALSGVVSQRLVARICTHCTVPYHPAQTILEAIGLSSHEARAIDFKRGRGCRTCRGRGYLGRFGLYEVLEMDEQLRILVMRGAPEAELERVAEGNGMDSLRRSALAAVKAGITTPEEMGRVVLHREIAPSEAFAVEMGCRA